MRHQLRNVLILVGVNGGWKPVRISELETDLHWLLWGRAVRLCYDHTLDLADATKSLIFLCTQKRDCCNLSRDMIWAIVGCLKGSLYHQILTVLLLRLFRSITNKRALSIAWITVWWIWELRKLVGKNVSVSFELKHNLKVFWMSHTTKNKIHCNPSVQTLFLWSLFWH